MLTQLVGTCLHIISMKQQDYPGGFVPPICQIRPRLHRRWNIWCKSALPSDWEPSRSKLDYLMLAQLVGRCPHIISMKQQDYPGGLVPLICKLQAQHHRSWIFGVGSAGFLLDYTRGAYGPYRIYTAICQWLIRVKNGYFVLRKRLKAAMDKDKQNKGISNSKQANEDWMLHWIRGERENKEFLHRKKGSAGKWGAEPAFEIAKKYWKHGQTCVILQDTLICE